MTSSVYVGLSGPTYFDYKHEAGSATNDIGSSPNPVLENAFGLAVFYDEIWFLCESLCPYSMRGHPKVKYVDKEFSRPMQSWVHEEIRNIIANQDVRLNVDGEVISDNFRNYRDLMSRAGVHWVKDGGGGLDNHSHGIRILDVVTSANSNDFSSLYTDIQVLNILRRVKGGMDLSLNSFGQHLHRRLCPAEYHPDIMASSAAQLGALIISARITNSLGIAGPDPVVFERICESGFGRDFRGYIAAKNIEDAAKVYVDVIAEIDDAIRLQVRTAATDARPVKGLVNMAVDTAVDISGVGTAKALLRWYRDAINPSPLGAAAFLYDLD